jgi:2-polyprenyl-3-methyl-5-hydroxy-6-metoxy-1,4-benzoquinol methylase
MNDSRYIKCPLCGVDDHYVRYPSTLQGDLQEMNPEHYRCTSHDLSMHGDIVQCRQCGMIYNNPQPDPDMLLGIYKDVADPLYLEESEARERTFKRSIDQLHQFIQPPGKLLDVGCYTGVFMKIANTEGWQTQGVELSSWAADIARKARVGNVFETPLEQLPVPEENFDLITLWDVIEHLTHPKDMLQNINRILKPGGIVAFSTHMVDSLAVRIMGKRYPFFMEMHLVHFSQETISRMLAEQGFQLLKIKSHPRILRTGYFLEKLYHKVKFQPIHSIVKWMSGKKWISQRFIRIGFLGLVNIFARKLNGIGINKDQENHERND